MLPIKKNKEGLTLLNIGCGDIFSTEWNNIDFTPQPGVAFADIRKGLPFPDESFDAVYHAHLLEHLSLSEAKKFCQETCRILKPRGTLRISTPDLEKAAQDYLNYLSQAWASSTPDNKTKYQWVVLSFLDQLTREKPGGFLIKELKTGRFDKNFVIQQNGEELAVFFENDSQTNEKGTSKSLWQKIAEKGLQKSFIAAWRKLQGLYKKPDPRQTGEAHKWLYDRLSLKILLEENGFADFSVKTFDQSAIPDWTSYRLDHSLHGSYPHKPDSIYIEARRV